MERLVVILHVHRVGLRMKLGDPPSREPLDETAMMLRPYNKFPRCTFFTGRIPNPRFVPHDGAPWALWGSDSAPRGNLLRGAIYDVLYRLTKK